MAWISFKVLRTDGNSGLGYIVIHRFRNVFLMHRLKQKQLFENARDKVEFNPKTDVRAAFQLIFIGERDILQYIKTQVDLSAAKVPPSAMSYEFEA